MDKTVAELFAGVGGFRVAFNDVTLENGQTVEKDNFKFVWSNQWEPSTKQQHAFDCYQKRFGGSSSENSNQDISLIEKKDIPDHTVLCGGFPCQDYSVARSLSKEKGIEGKKGVLFWQIDSILSAKKPPFVLLENVNRLVKSPSKQRGRDFGIMLRAFSNQGYAVEWRIINAAEYGYPQRRRRIYIFAYRNNTEYYKKMVKVSPGDLIKSKGLFAKAFPVEQCDKQAEKIDLRKNLKDLVAVSDNFKAEFENSGCMIKGKAYTLRTTPVSVSPITLNEIVITDGVDAHFFLEKETKAKYKFLRGSKKIPRTAANGVTYYYTEGSMSNFDSLDLPGRTMLTSESTTNRSTHIIKDPRTRKLRLLTPVECERLNQFPDDWTNTGMPERRRYFMMGNALVCGVIKKISRELSSIIDDENKESIINVLPAESNISGNSTTVNTPIQYSISPENAVVSTTSAPKNTSMQ